MEEIGAFDAKNKLSALLDKVEGGEEVTITRRGRPIAKLVPVSPRHDVEKARGAMQRIRTLGQQMKLGPFDWDEWKKYRDEGRR